jgi:cell division transport system ATP-binding protein
MNLSDSTILSKKMSHRCHSVTLHIWGTMILATTSGRGEGMIKIENVSKSYNGNSVIEGLSFHIGPGEFVFLQGESGSGKSTLLKLLYRELEQFDGRILIEGKQINLMPKYMTRRIVGTIFQSFELLERKTTLENVALAGEVLGRKESDIIRESMDLLEKVGLKGKEDRFPHQLSGGEQQRVAIARALLNRPKVLLADEPTGNLDPQNAVKIMELLQEINIQEGITMLIVTHSQDLIDQFSARTLHMENGQVREREHIQLLST